MITKAIYGRPCNKEIGTEAGNTNNKGEKFRRGDLLMLRCKTIARYGESSRKKKRIEGGMEGDSAKTELKNFTLRQGESGINTEINWAISTSKATQTRQRGGGRGLKGGALNDRSRFQERRSENSEIRRPSKWTTPGEPSRNKREE